MPSLISSTPMVGPLASPRASGSPTPRPARSPPAIATRCKELPRTDRAYPKLVPATCRGYGVSHARANGGGDDRDDRLLPVRAFHLHHLDHLALILDPGAAPARHAEREHAASAATTASEGLQTRPPH